MRRPIRLAIAPAHLTDIEKERRTPSEDLMLRIAREYGMPEEDLRSGWSRADAVVNEMAIVTPTNAKKVPEFLRTAGDLTPEQWDTLIKQAKLFSKKPTNGGRGETSPMAQVSAASQRVLATCRRQGDLRPRALLGPSWTRGAPAADPN